MPTTTEGCKQFLLSANGGAPESDLNHSIYNRLQCNFRGRRVTGECIASDLLQCDVASNRGVARCCAAQTRPQGPKLLQSSAW